MRIYRGIVKGKTIVLEEKPDIPDNSPALVTITLVGRLREESVVKEQLELLRNPHKGGKLLFRRREELYERWKESH